MEAPVSVSLGVVRSLPAKLERLLSPEADSGLRLRNGEKSKIRLLKERLQDLMDKYLMEPSDVEAPASTARCWVKEVRELSYDIDDFLDELAHGFHPPAAAAQKNLRGKVARLREGLSRSRWVSQETARFRVLLEEAIQRHKRYILGNRQIRATRIDSDELPIRPLCGVEGARLVGLDSAMETLGEWLTGDGEQQLRVVSIVGPGGVGKTTLSKELYCKLRSRFECRAFARSSQKPDMRRLLTSILVQVRPQRLLDDTETELVNLIGTIRAHLQHKKYFIIIDDLWDSSMWDIVRRALPDDKCCSRVLATTEIDVVAQICSGHNSEHIFKMKPLTDDESKKLFFSRFPCDQSENSEQWYEVSSEIIRKCGGFPLATISIASLLARQQNWVEQCNCIRRSLGSNLRTAPTIEGMKQVLCLCYNNLPGYLKACLLYLSIYKEDHIIWKDDLVKQWMAEGFICAKDGRGKEEVASTYFDELVNVGMIQPVDINYNGEVLSCTVHYMILNLIRYMSIEENFVTAVDHSQANIRLADKVRRLSLQFGDSEDASQPTKLRLLQVQSLVFFGLFKSLPSIAEFRLLRVLILHLWGDQDNKSFDLTTVGQLFRLRYLEIVCNVTLDLQTKMQGLKHLETLRIDSRISEVPPDIVHLPGLLHLSLPGDTKLPNGISQLISLQAFGCFDLSSNSVDNVLSLGELTNLQELCLTCSTMASDKIEEKLLYLGTILSKLNNLKHLTMLPAASSNATLEASASSNNISCDRLSGVSPPPALQKLELLPRICIFSILPKWIGKLRLLGILKIQVMGLSSDDVDILGGLPALSALLLYVRTTSADRILFGKAGFPVLKHFKFICSAICIAFMKGAMPNVRRLKLGFNASTLVQYSPADAGFKHLTGLKEIYAKVGNAGADEFSRMAAQSALEDAFSPHRVNINFVDCTFCGEKERNMATVKEEHEILEICNPIPDVITKESTDEQCGIGEKSSKQDTDKQSDHLITGLLCCWSPQINKKDKIWAQGKPQANKVILGTGSKNRSRNATDTDTFGTKTSASSLLVPSTLHTEIEILESSNVRKFTFSELKGSTRNFRPDSLLGEGSFGSVFKGWVDKLTLAPMKPGSGMSVAVKKLKVDSFQGHREWLAEVKYSGQLSHPNFVKLIGYCLEDEHRLLVYEYMPRGSLANHLFRKMSHFHSLPWNLRMKIALEAARGLAFLHSDLAHVIYRNFKTSKILLDLDYSAKLFDFSMAKDGPIGDRSHVSTRVMGTFGYAAPEYIATGHLTTKSDVYSYGVVLLELLSGQRSIDMSRPHDQRNLVEWATPCISSKRRLHHVLDPRLGSQYSHHGAQKIAALALRCLLQDPRRRPDMDEVVTVLEGLQKAKGAVKTGKQGGGLLTGDTHYLSGASSCNTSGE